MKNRTMIPIEQGVKDRLKVVCAKLKISYSDYIAITIRRSKLLGIKEATRHDNHNKRA